MKPYYRVEISLPDKQRVFTIEFVEYRKARKVHYTVYDRVIPTDLTKWTRSWVATGFVPTTAKLHQTPGVAR